MVGTNGGRTCWWTIRAQLTEGEQMNSRGYHMKMQPGPTFPEVAEVVIVVLRYLSGESLFVLSLSDCRGQ